MTILSKKKGNSSTKNCVGGGGGNGGVGGQGGGGGGGGGVGGVDIDSGDLNHGGVLPHPLVLPHPQIQPESLNLNPERLSSLYGTERSLSSPSQLWSSISHSQNLSHSLSTLSNTREEKRASQQQSLQYEHQHIESPNSMNIHPHPHPHPHPLPSIILNQHHHQHHGGKRRHRASPIRFSRSSKHSRLDRLDRGDGIIRPVGSVSSPSSCGGIGGGVGGGSIPGGGSPNVSVSPSGQSDQPALLTANCNLPSLSSSPEVANYNSEDEYESRPHSQLSEEEWVERERRFEKKMRKKGYIIKKMGEDGACLFRAVSDQVYGDQEMHTVVRKHCMDYIAANEDYYSQYVTEDFNHYVNRKRLEYVHGNHIEIQAMSEMYNRTIEVFCYSTDPINIFHGTNQSDNEPIRLSYHRGVHYNSLVDPYKATVGVGLGLPGHIPGLADKNVVKEATRQSEDVLIEQAMLEDKLRATDWEATNEALEEQVARESYLQWLKDNERRNRAVRSPTTTASSSSATATSASSSEVRSPRHRGSQGGSNNISPLGSPFRGESSYKHSPSRLSPPPPSLPGPSRPNNLSPLHLGSSSSPPKSPTTSNPGNNSASLNSTESSFQLLETSSFINQLPPELFGMGMNEWEDAGLMAQVLAVSQQEYLDNLKRSNNRDTLSSTTPPPLLPQPPSSSSSSSNKDENSSQ